MFALQAQAKVVLGMYLQLPSSAVDKGFDFMLEKAPGAFFLLP
jgi:hypothetical protein